MRDYFIIEFVYKCEKRYCVWYTSDVDGFIIKDNQVLCFDDVDALKSYCSEQKFELNDDEIYSCNVDTICDWLSGEITSFYYPTLLDFWNTAHDAAKSAAVDFYGDNKGIVLDIYDKIFYATMLPVLKGEGEVFIPAWDEEEIFELKKIMRDAVKILCKFCLHTEAENSVCR